MQQSYQAVESYTGNYDQGKILKILNRCVGFKKAKLPNFAQFKIDTGELTLLKSDLLLLKK